MDENQEVPESSSSNNSSPQMSNSSVSVTESGTQAAPAKSKVPLAAFVILVVLALAGWGAYSAYASPSKVWNKFVAHPTMPSVLSQSFTFAYQDHGKASSSTAASPMASIITNVKFSGTGTGFTNNTNPANPESSADISYSVGSGDTSISSKLQLVVKDQNVFFNLGDNPLINGIMASLSPTEKIDWLKVNLQELKDQAQASASGTSASTFDFAQQVKGYQAIISKHAAKLVTIDTYLGKETLHGVATLHFSNKLDKVEAKALISDLVDYMTTQMVSNGQLKQEEASKTKTTAQNILNSFVDRLQVQAFETWIGGSDGQLHKVKFSSNAPSLISMVSQAMDSESDIALKSDPEKVTENAFAKVAFDGQVNLEEEFYDFGKVQVVKVPEKSFDIMQKIKEQSQNQFQMPLDSTTLKSQ